MCIRFFFSIDSYDVRRFSRGNTWSTLWLRSTIAASSSVAGGAWSPRADSSKINSARTMGGQTWACGEQPSLIMGNDDDDEEEWLIMVNN